MNLKPRQVQFLAALLQSRTLKDAAKSAGISERTAARWLENPDVQAALRAAQDDALRQASRIAAGNAGLAVDILRAMAVADDVGAMARIAACRELLKAALSFNETIEVTNRLAALEAALFAKETD